MAIGRSLARPAAVMVTAVLVPACLAATARRPDAEPRPRPAGLLGVRWRTVLNDQGAMQARPGECASGVVVRDKLIIGSRAAAVVGVDAATGRVDWTTPVSGGLDSQARFDEARGHVYLGTDDGALYAVDPSGGAVRWSYRSKGSIEQAVEIGNGAVYSATAADRVFALDAGTGKWLWQYERESPEGFTIAGHAGPRLRGGHLLSGFSDGYLVALDHRSGEVVWARSLASASNQFVDVDATPTIAGDGVFVSSYSGGLYALDPRDGSVRWRLAVVGVGTVSLHGRHLYFAAPREGLHATDLNGNVMWRQGLSEAGDLSPPIVVQRYLVFSGSRAGLFVVDRATGTLAEIFNPGRGICGAPAVDPRGDRLYVLANGGALYALDLASP